METMAFKGETMKPNVICHMIASLDGSLHPSRCTASPDGSRAEWSEIYEEVHRTFKGDAWLVGRVTMAEMTKASPHAPMQHSAVERPYHFATRSSGRYAVAVDPSGKLHFAKAEISGDHVVVLLGRDVPDSHLAELSADGVSYIVAEPANIDLAARLVALGVPKRATWAPIPTPTVSSTMFQALYEVTPALIQSRMRPQLSAPYV